MAGRKPSFKSPVPIKARESSEKLWGYNTRRRGVDWAQVDGLGVKTALLACLEGGGALMFSAAAGGLGVCITMFSDGDKAREYAATTEELDQLLDQVVDYFADASVDYRQVMVGGGAISASGN